MGGSLNESLRCLYAFNPGICSTPQMFVEVVDNLEVFPKEVSIQLKIKLKLSIDKMLFSVF